MQYNKGCPVGGKIFGKVIVFMNNFGNGIRSFFAKLGAGFRRFMAGRYGTDRLNMVILCVALVASIVSTIVSNGTVTYICFLLSYGLMFWAIFRCLSRNTYKRYQENRRFLMFFDHLKDRKNRYFTCPKCHQTVRVPRGKGKISITCPRCKEKFIKKT